MEQVVELVESYPPPPPYFKLYTDENVENGIAPEPPAPLQGPYSMFGTVFTSEDHLPTLDELGRLQLYPKGDDINHTEELRRLNHSLLFNYIELLNTCIHNPKDWRKKVEDIDLLFVNMHHLLNSYRPHQARDTLITIMQNQVQRRIQTLQIADSRFRDVEKILQEAAQKLEDSDTLNLSASDKEMADAPMASPTTKEEEEESNLLMQMESILDTITDM